MIAGHECQNCVQHIINVGIVLPNKKFASSLTDDNNNKHEYLAKNETMR